MHEFNQSRGNAAKKKYGICLKRSAQINSGELRKYVDAESSHNHHAQPKTQECIVKHHKTSSRTVTKHEISNQTEKSCGFLQNYNVYWLMKINSVIH